MIHITGDVNLTDGFFDTGFGVGSSIAKGADPFAKIERDIERDLWIGNFEGVVAHTSPRNGIYGKQFIVVPEQLASLRHFDYYGVANNHVMQHGTEAYREMLSSLRSLGSVCFGTADQHSAAFVHHGVKFSITGFSQRKENFSETPLYWYDPEYAEIRAEYEHCRCNDFKIAYVHWGIEFMNRPYGDQIRFAHALVDMGFDLVVGMHPHLLQGYECYKGRYIYYSLGNFVFNMHWEPLRYGAVLHLDVKNTEVCVSHDYVRIDDDYFPRIVPEDEVPIPYRFAYLNELLHRKASNEEYFKALREYSRRYKRDNRWTILRNLSRLGVCNTFAICKDFICRHI